MPKIKLLLFFLFISQVIFSQKNLSIGIDYFPNVSVSPADKYNDRAPKFSNSIGLTLSKQMHKRLWMSSGINFADIGRKRVTHLLRWGTQHNGQGGFDPTIDPMENSDNIVSILNHYSLEVPVKLIYKIIDKKFKLYASGGVMIRGYLTSRVRMIENISYGPPIAIENDGQVDFQKITIGYQTGIGLEQQFLSRFKVFLEPRFQWNPIRGDNGYQMIKDKFMSYGLGTGIKMDL